MTGTGRLTTIPFSHYCGLARWALERAGIAFEEDRYAPVFHMFPARRRGGARTLPVWEFDGRTIQGSLAILRWADERLPASRKLWPAGPDADRQCERLETFDRRFGPATRRIAYVAILDERELIDRELRTQLPAGRARRWRALAPLTHPVMRRALRLDAAGAERSTRVIEEVFEIVANDLEDGGPYLAGERFGATDLAFASLAAPILVPPEDGTLPAFDALPPDYARRVEAWRRHPAGAHGLRVWSRHRHEAAS